MNHLSSHLNDRVFIENSTGERAGPYASIIDSKNGLSALILEEKLDVEEGWKTIRSLPNGKEETYTIMEATYSPGMGEGIPPFWTLKLSKDSSLVRPRAEQSATTINISNSQGIQIGDHNTQHIANSLTGLVEMIESSNAHPEEKREAKDLLRKFLENPSVAAVLGATASGLLALLA